MPSAIGKVARFRGMFRRTGQDHIEHRLRRKGREEVRTHSCHAIAEAVGAGVLNSRERSIWIDIGSYGAFGASARRRQREDARPGSHVHDALAPEVKTGDERGKLLAANKVTGVKDRRAHGEAEAGGSREARALSGEDQVVGKEMNETTKTSTERAVRCPLTT